MKEEKQESMGKCANVVEEDSVSNKENIYDWRYGMRNKVNVGIRNIRSRNIEDHSSQTRSLDNDRLTREIFKDLSLIHNLGPNNSSCEGPLICEKEKKTHPNYNRDERSSL